MKLAHCRGRSTTAFVIGNTGPVFRSSLRMKKCHHQLHASPVMTIGRRNFDPSVYLVTDRTVTAGWTVEQIVQAAIHRQEDGRRNRGVTFVQLRDKHQDWDDSIRLGRELRKLTREADVAFVVNDNIELAHALGADGVHVGQDDRSVREVRDALGSEAIVGVSTHAGDEAEKAIEDGADYIGVGCIFGTATKGDAGSAIGVGALAEVVKVVRGRVPVVAIGGVHRGNAADCWKVGADGVAVVSAIMKSEDPGEVAKFLNETKRKLLKFS